MWTLTPNLLGITTVLAMTWAQPVTPENRGVVFDGPIEVHVNSSDKRCWALEGAYSIRIESLAELDPVKDGPCWIGIVPLGAKKVELLKYPLRENTLTLDGLKSPVIVFWLDNPRQAPFPARLRIVREDRK